MTTLPVIRIVSIEWIPMTWGGWINFHAIGRHGTLVKFPSGSRTDFERLRDAVQATMSLLPPPGSGLTLNDTVRAVEQAIGPAVAHPRDFTAVWLAEGILETVVFDGRSIAVYNRWGWPASAWKGREPAREIIPLAAMVAIFWRPRSRFMQEHGIIAFVANRLPGASIMFTKTQASFIALREAVQDAMDERLPGQLPPGWYSDPDTLGFLRWWDGWRWTHWMKPHPDRPTPPSIDTSGGGVM